MTNGIPIHPTSLTAKGIPALATVQMTPADVKARVAELRALVGKDDDAACSGAEQLRCEVLHAIAEGAGDPTGLAREVLVTIDEDIGGD